MDNGAPTAIFLQARINALTTTLVQRIENIYAIALPNPTPSLTTIATDQLQVDVEATALVRAAEEVMVLTRLLKDLWLFGGLDTLRKEGDGVVDAQVEEDARVVAGFLKRFGAGDETKPAKYSSQDTMKESEDKEL